MKTSSRILTLVISLLIAMPELIFAQVLNINNGVQVVADGTVNVVVDGAGIKNDGIFKPDSSTVIFSGGAITAISGTQPTTFYNATFRGTGTKTNNGSASVINTLAVEGTTTLDADGSANDRQFTILSSDTVTGRVAILTTGNVIGNVTVERFINTGTGPGEHGKSWQFLATPTTGQSAFQAWQEGGTTPAGFGTWISGTGIGFDVTTVLPSLKFYNPPTNTWTAVTNTTLSLQNRQGYMLFVRGDRTVVTVAGTPNNTNMRSKGVLFTPSNPPLSVPVAANLFQSFGNPYASRIQFNQVFLASTGINNVFYVWDPLLAGTWGLGGYQTISAVAGYIPTAGSSTTYYPAGVPSPNIESGQAVFVRGNVTGGNVNFNENCKVSGSRLVNKGESGTEEFFPPSRQFLSTTLFTNTGKIADGNIVSFESGFGNEVNEYDAIKPLNSGENLGLSRDEKLLSVEAREPISINDTIFYDIKNLRQQPYQLRFSPLNITPGYSAFLIDRSDNSSTSVSLIDSSFIDFNVVAGEGSNAADRFILVFRRDIVVPVKIVSISAHRNSDRSNQVLWKTENEINLQEYVIERSSDGLNFHSLGNTHPVANNGGTGSYTYRDGFPLSDVSFYRIRAVSTNSQIQYSAIVKVATVSEASDIAVYPNPVTDRKINITFKNQIQGNYSIQLINEIGQILYRKIVYISRANEVFTIKPDILAAGTYQLLIIKEDGSRETEQVIVP